MHMHGTDASCCCQHLQPTDSCILMYSLNMLQAQCELWSGPIAAVAYMPLVKGRLVSMDDATVNGTTVEESKAKLAAFYDAVSHAGTFTDVYSTDSSTCIQGFTVKPQDHTRVHSCSWRLPRLYTSTCTQLVSCCTPLNKIAERGMHNATHCCRICHL